MTANLNWVDYLILSIFFFSVLAGLARGLVKEIVSLITLVAAFVIATVFSNPVANAFTSSASVRSVVTESSNAIGMSTAQPVSYAAIGVSFAILFIVTIIIGAVIGSVLNIAFQTGMLGLGNRLFGAAFGFVRGFIINLVLIFLVQLTPLGQSGAWAQSQMVGQFQPAVMWLAGIVSPTMSNLKERLGQSLQGVGSSLQNTVQSFSR